MTHNKEPQVADAAAIAEGLSEAQRRAIAGSQLEDWPGKSAIYMARGLSAADALALWRLGVIGEYTNIEDWFSPLTDLGSAVRKILQERAA